MIVSTGYIRSLNAAVWSQRQLFETMIATRKPFMAGRLKPLSQPEHAQVQAELKILADRAAQLGNTLGPAYGAAWCDKALKLSRSIQTLGTQVDDEFFRKSRLR